MAAVAAYNEFGIQSSLLQRRQLVYLPASFFFPSQSLERFMKWWWIFKQTTSAKRCPKTNLALPHHPFLEVVLCQPVTTYILNVAGGLTAKPNHLWQFQSLHSDQQRQVSHILCTKHDLILSYMHNFIPPQEEHVLVTATRSQVMQTAFRTPSNLPVSTTAERRGEISQEPTQ